MCRKGSVDHVEKKLGHLHAVLQGPGKSWKTPRKVLESCGKPPEMFGTNPAYLSASVVVIHY